MKKSKKGKTFSGDKLTDINLFGGTSVMWCNKIYKTGNRKNNEVELFTNNEFVRVVTMDSISLLDETTRYSLSFKERRLQRKLVKVNALLIDLGCLGYKYTINPKVTIRVSLRSY